MKTGSKIAIIVFTIVAVAHLLRLIYNVDITVGDWAVPQWISVLGVIGPGLIAWILWKESK